MSSVLHAHHKLAKIIARITFWRIIKNKSTEQFSGIPYVMTLMNCLLSAWYGLPFISKDNLLVSTVNGAGVVIEIIYVLIFILYAPKKEKLKISAISITVFSLFAVIALVSVLAFHGAPRRLLCGLSACIFSVIMYASPLSIIRLVIKTRSVEYMPFFLSLFSFLCGTSWFIFGLIGNDPFLYVNNGFGCALGAVQLILYFIYRFCPMKKQFSADDTTLEMGIKKPQQCSKADQPKSVSLETNANVDA